MIHLSRFLSQTDYKPLLAIPASHNGTSVHTANHLQRWTKIQTIKNVGHVDSLSRLIARRATVTEDIVVAAPVCQLFRDTCQSQGVTD